MLNIDMLEKAIRDSGIKRKCLAEKLGISIQTLRLKCIGKYDFTLNEVRILCAELNLTKAQASKIFDIM